MAGDAHPLDDVPLSALAERAHDLRHEVEYWQQVLGDCGALAAYLAVVTEQLLASTIAAAVIRTGEPGMATAAADEVLEANARAMPQVLAAMRVVSGIIDLANGRGLAIDPTLVALSARLCVNLDDDETPPQ